MIDDDAFLPLSSNRVKNLNASMKHIKFEIKKVRKNARRTHWSSVNFVTPTIVCF